jgi:hypothetical protein
MNKNNRIYSDKINWKKLIKIWKKNIKENPNYG